MERDPVGAVRETEAFPLRSPLSTLVRPVGRGVGGGALGPPLVPPRGGRAGEPLPAAVGAARAGAAAVRRTEPAVGGAKRAVGRHGGEAQVAARARAPARAAAPATRTPVTRKRGRAWPLRGPAGLVRRADRERAGRSDERAVYAELHRAPARTGSRTGGTSTWPGQAAAPQPPDRTPPVGRRVFATLKQHSAPRGAGSNATRSNGDPAGLQPPPRRRAARLRRPAGRPPPPPRGPAGAASMTRPPPPPAGKPPPPPPPQTHREPPRPRQIDLRAGLHPSAPSNGDGAGSRRGGSRTAPSGPSLQMERGTGGEVREAGP